VQLIRDTLWADDPLGMPESRPMHRRIAAVIAPGVDISVFCALLAANVSLRSSHLSAFAVGIALTWLLKFRSVGAAALRTSPWRLALRMLVVALMAVFLRAGVLGLLIQRLDWPPQAAILVAVVFGLAVTLPGNGYALSAADGESRWRAFAVGLIAYAFALRLVFAGSVELLPEESYYWNYSQHLDFGYLDHPPMVAWLIRLGTALFGQNEFGVRIGAIACGIVTSWFVYRLTRNLFGQASALAALLLVQALPFFFLSGLLLTPDSPLTAAWAAALYFLERALVGGEARAWWGAGIAIGLGLFSKYSIALLCLATVVFMCWDPPSRRWWSRREPYLAALIAAAIFSPVIVWNAQHAWVSFAFQTSRRLAEAPQFALHKLIGSLIVLFTPTGMLSVAVLVLAGTMSSAAVGARQWRLMRLAILMPLSVFALFSLRHEVKLDWTGASWTAALPFMGCIMLGAGIFATRRYAWIRAAWAPTAVLMVLSFGALLHYLVLGLPGAPYSKHIETTPVGWRDLSRHITETAAALRKNTGREVLIVGMDRYAIASQIAFYGSAYLHTTLETTNSYLFDGMSLMYGLWDPPRQQEHRDLLLVAWDPSELSGKSVEPHVGRLGPIEEDVLMRDGSLVRHYYHRLAYNYRSTINGNE
jgi:dolichol-phosphate mannosyltransferase